MAFVGAGGKTTTMFRLARQMPGPVLVTASTHLGVEQIEDINLHVVVQGREDLSPLLDGIPEGITLVTGTDGSDKRAKGLPFELMEELQQIAHSQDIPMLIEADGSRQRPLKASAEHEPAIPGFVNTVVVLAGMSGVGRRLDEEWVHRPEWFEKLSGVKVGEKISTEDVVRVLTHQAGGLKNIPDGVRKIVLLNQADTDVLAAEAKGMVKDLLRSFDGVLIGKMIDEAVEVRSLHQKIAGIVLAAGGAKRMGKAKQLLTYHGEPFVRRVARTALEAGLNPVIVVTGSYHEEVRSAMEGVGVGVVHNPAWEAGQSTSVNAGLGAVDTGVGAAVFLLADQPRVPHSLVSALVEEHARTMAPIVAPLVSQHRGNPVLFDRATFPDFEVITGDAGGRQIFSKHKVVWVPWVDGSVLMDVDTEEDYDRLVG